MIADCMRYNHNRHVVLEAFAPVPEHPERECAMIVDYYADRGPNLLIWNGTAHKLVLSIKD